MQVVLKKILCPLDFSKNSFLALRYSIAFARADNASITLLHVVTPTVTSLPGEVGLLNVPPGTSEEIIASSSKRLQTIAQDIAGEVAHVDTTVLYGTPFIEICCHAVNHETDLIVMGSRGRGRLSHFLIGSVTEQVLRKAPCPVLTVKDRDRELLRESRRRGRAAATTPPTPPTPPDASS